MTIQCLIRLDVFKELTRDINSVLLINITKTVTSSFNHMNDSSVMSLYIYNATSVDVSDVVHDWLDELVLINVTKSVLRIFNEVYYKNALHELYYS